MNNKKLSKLILITALSAALILICAVFACKPQQQSEAPPEPIISGDPSESAEAPTPEPTPEASQEPTPLPEPAVNADGTVCLDRLSVDLSGIEMPPAGDPDFDSGIPRTDPNEVRIRDASSNFAFKLSALPPYDESLESSYGLGGYRISLALFVEDAGNQTFKGTRAITDVSDCAYILNKTLQQGFVPNENSIYKGYPWLFICFENDFDSEMLCVGKDGYLYHTKSVITPGETYWEFEPHPSQLEYDYVSKEPIDAETRLHLAAMALHYTRYVHYRCNPVVFPARSEYDPYEENIEILIEYNSETYRASEPEKLIELAKLFDKAEGIDGPANALIYQSNFKYTVCAKELLLNEDDMLARFEIRLKGSDDTLDYFFLTNDGRIATYARVLTPNYIDAEPLYFSTSLEMVSVTSFPLDELIAFIESCK